MAIGSRRNFTITDLNKRTIVLRRCEPGGALGTMRLTPVYRDSYSLALSYKAGSSAAWTGEAGTEPDLVDLATVENADPPISSSVNTVTSIQVDKNPGVPEDGTVSQKFGFNGAFDIQAGSPFRKPKVIPVEVEDAYKSTRLLVPGQALDGSMTLTPGGVLFDTIYVWGVEIDKDAPVSTLTVGGVQDPDDPLKTRYTIPFSPSSAPEWAPGGVALAYKYKLGDFMEGIIRLRAPGAGGITPSPVCGTSIE